MKTGIWSCLLIAFLCGACASTQNDIEEGIEETGDAIEDAADEIEDEMD